jgi:hypothetical protein
MALDGTAVEPTSKSISAIKVRRSTKISFIILPQPTRGSLASTIRPWCRREFTPYPYDRLFVSCRVEVLL